MQNYTEKMKNRLMVRRKIYELSKKVPVDLMVHTKEEMKVMNITAFLTGILMVSFIAAPFNEPVFGENLTENVFLVVIDGLRSDEAFSSDKVMHDFHPYIPVMWSELRPSGTLCSEVYDLNFTSTLAAHTQMLTGNPCNYPNYIGFGKYHRVRLDDPTIFEYFRHQTGAPTEMTYAVSGKEHIVRLGFSMNPVYRRKDGITIIHPGDDSSDPVVWETLLAALDEQHPALVLVNFEDVDNNGHLGVWENYIQAIGYVDSLMGELWNRIESDPIYAGRTTLLITTDHGRHSNLPRCIGFMHHGGLCMGCRRTFLLALGPDTPPGATISEPFDQQDICYTIGGLLNFDTPLARSRIMWDVLGVSDPPEPEVRKYYPQLIADGGRLYRVYVEDTSEEYNLCVDQSLDEGATWFGKAVVSTSPWELKSPTMSYDGTRLRVGWQEMEGLISSDLFSSASEDMGLTWGEKEVVHRCQHEFSHLDVIRPRTKLIEVPQNLANQAIGPLMLEANNNWTILMHRPAEQPGPWKSFSTGINKCFIRDLSADFITDTKIIVAYSDLSKFDITPAGQKRNYEILLTMGEFDEHPWSWPVRVTNDTCSSIQPTICVKDETEALLVWADNMDDGILQLYSYKINLEIGEFSERMKITENSFGAWQPTGLYDHLSGNYYIAWSGSEPEENNIYFGIFKPDSSWETGLLEYTEGYSQHPAITLDEITGRKFVVWEEISRKGDWSLKCSRIPETS